MGGFLLKFARLSSGSELETEQIRKINIYGLIHLKYGRDTISSEKWTREKTIRKKLNLSSFY